MVMGTLSFVVKCFVSPQENVTSPPTLPSQLKDDNAIYGDNLKSWKCVKNISRLIFGPLIVLFEFYDGLHIIEISIPKTY